MSEVAVSQNLRTGAFANPLRRTCAPERVRSAWMFLAPTLLILAVVAGWPLLRTIYFGFTNTSLTDLDGGKFVGFDNYLSWVTLPSGKVIYAALLVDPAWWNAVWNTVRSPSSR